MHATSVSAKSASPTDKFKLKHKNGSKDNLQNCNAFPTVLFL